MRYQKTNCIREGCTEEANASGFCSGRCKHIYRSGKDPHLCPTCQIRRPATRGINIGYCSRRCQLA